MKRFSLFILACLAFVVMGCSNPPPSQEPTQEANVGVEAAAEKATSEPTVGEEAPPENVGRDVDEVSGVPDGGGTDAEPTDTVPDAVADKDPNPQRCQGYDPKRKNLYWGDLHVHTRTSFDAYFFNTLNGPREAYRFAKGESVGLPCEDPDQKCRSIKLGRPLDFTAVTDHGEFLGAFEAQCLNARPGMTAACNAVGQYMRGNIDQFTSGNTPVDPSQLAGLGVLDPTSGWKEIQKISQEENQPCSFTTFVAYEYSAQPAGAMMHRNIIFANDKVPSRAWSSNDVSSAWELFSKLEQECGNGSGCDYLSIPHNPNLSDGRMFRKAGSSGVPTGRSDKPMTVEDAKLMAKRDRLVEIVQHKGQSECMPGFGFDLLGNDEKDLLCAFEMVKPVCSGDDKDLPHCKPKDKQICQTSSSGTTPASPDNCTAPLDMVRVALAEGLAVRKKLQGVNPYQLGFVGASDTHNGTPGAVSESNFRGHGGVVDYPIPTLMGGWSCDINTPGCNRSSRNWQYAAFPYAPGGLTAVWAQENTRASIFAALKRREAYATSGPRIRVRTYASWSPWPSDMCDQLKGGKNPVESGAVSAVPMGSNLPANPGSQGPHLVVWAAQDAGDSNRAGAPLQRIQIIKGWVDAQGNRKAKVFELAGTTSATPPDKQCKATTTGSSQLCGTWQDPTFDPKQEAFYYARVVEVPTCRWNTLLCVAKGVDCSNLSRINGTFSSSSGFKGYEGCCKVKQNGATYSGTHRFDVIQERAWTSPVWYLAP